MDATLDGGIVDRNVTGARPCDVGSRNAGLSIPNPTGKYLARDEAFNLANKNFQRVVFRGVSEHVVRLKNLVKRELLGNEGLDGQLLLSHEF